MPRRDPDAKAQDARSSSRAAVHIANQPGSTMKQARAATRKLFRSIRANRRAARAGRRRYRRDMR